VKWNDENILLRLSQAPIPPLHRLLLDSLQAKLGLGIAPSFSDILDSANMSTFVGGSAVAAEIAGYFEMAVGAGIDMSWANVTADDVRNMLPLIVYQHNVWMRALPLAQHAHSNLLAHVLRDLDPLSPSGTSFYVGHDRCLLASCILLRAHMSPMPPNSKAESATSMDWLRCWESHGAASRCPATTLHLAACCALTFVALATSHRSQSVLLMRMSLRQIQLPCAWEQLFSRTRIRHQRLVLWKVLMHCFAH